MNGPLNKLLLLVDGDPGDVGWKGELSMFVVIADNGGLGTLLLRSGDLGCTALSGDRGC